MLRAFLRDITPREAKGLVITMYRSTAITISVIILQIPNSAPQKAYNSQPRGGEVREGERSSGVEGQICLLTAALRINAFSGSRSCSSFSSSTAGNTVADCVTKCTAQFYQQFWTHMGNFGGVFFQMIILLPYQIYCILC